MKPYLDFEGVQSLVNSIIEKFAKVIHKHTVSDITDFPTIPTKTSELVNDSGYQTTDNNTIYSLSKDGTSIMLIGSDESLSVVEESVTTVTDDNVGNVVLESSSAVTHVNEAIKQEIINATIASLKTETLTFTLDDGTTITKEVVVKQ